MKLPDFAGLAWESDIELALLENPKPSPGNHEYYWFTVAHIEAGLSPTGIGRLTLSELREWVGRITATPSPNENNHADNKSSGSASHRGVRHITPR